MMCIQRGEQVGLVGQQSWVQGQALEFTGKLPHLSKSDYSSFKNRKRSGGQQSRLPRGLSHRV